jgi:hypothetical protein
MVPALCARPCSPPSAAKTTSAIQQAKGLIVGWFPASFSWHRPARDIEQSLDRSHELLDAIKQRIASVVDHDGRIPGYASALGVFGHAIGETNEDMKALIGAATSIAGPGLLMPSRNAELFRWCLNRGLRVVHTMTLMSMDLYNEPAGAFLPSVVY